MDYNIIIDTLEQNHNVFQNLLSNQSQDATLFRPHEKHWCLLEIVCHLYDEEREDFRTRVKTTLEIPGEKPPPIYPQDWVADRKYIDRNYEVILHKFLEERTKSIAWLRALSKPDWGNSYMHDQLGKLTAHHFISNWLAHDYLHIRQITRLKYNYLKTLTGEDLKYAGNW